MVTMGSKSVEPVFSRPFIRAMGVAVKKSRGWVCIRWWLPPVRVILRSVISQP